VEKKTDVNLALSMYRDVNRGSFDQVVLISNDTDTEPVMSALIEDFPTLKIGLIMPRGPQSSGKKGRPASSSLIKLAHWSRSYINDEELITAQLPEQVPTKKKLARKPIHWERIFLCSVKYRVPSTYSAFLARITPYIVAS
jgi:hypothetical protein